MRGTKSDFSSRASRAASALGSSRVAASKARSRSQRFSRADVSPSSPTTDSSTDIAARRAPALRRLRKKKIAVLYGGWSAERSISLKSGAAVLLALERLGLSAQGIDVTPAVSDVLRRARPDVAFLAMHGPFGEDGRLQGLLDILKIPYTGSGVLASACAMHKPTAKRLFESAGLATPEWFSILDKSAAPTPSFSAPWVVKPASQGSALGISVVRAASRWPAALDAAFALDREVLAERYVEGTEITVGILGDQALPVVEIVPRHAFYDFHSKYAEGGSTHIVPSRLPESVREKAQDLALEAHRVLGCRHFSRVDLRVSLKGEPTLLEVNTLPGLTDKSLLPDAASAAGIDFDGLILEILTLAAATRRPA